MPTAKVTFIYNGRKYRPDDEVNIAAADLGRYKRFIESTPKKTSAKKASAKDAPATTSNVVEAEEPADEVVEAEEVSDEVVDATEEGDNGKV